MSKNYHFPSGKWRGFYNYVPGGIHHEMEMELNFENGVIKGKGKDDIGDFVIHGKYDENSGYCEWIKKYVNAHEVFYWGYRDDLAIYGQWKIKTSRGGFYISPRITTAK